jgi:hypothetical protein
LIVLAEKIGQLGNRLFHFGHFIAFGRCHGVAVANPAFDEFARYFPAFSEDVLCRHPAASGRVRPTERRRRAAFESFRLLARLGSRLGGPSGPVGLVELAPGEFCDLRSPAFRREAERRRLLLVAGWLFRDDESFRREADLLRSLFTPHDVHRRRVECAIIEARRQCQVLVGVHVRHGDYAQYAGGRHYHPIEDYAAQLERVRELFPGRDVGFLVCSDAPANRAAFGDARVTPAPGHQVDDMYALAECDYIVGPPSTYSAWASFYGRVPLYHFEDPHAAITLADFTERAG